jgi:hypothetical protein
MPEAKVNCRKKRALYSYRMQASMAAAMIRDMTKWTFYTIIDISNRK